MGKKRHKKKRNATRMVTSTQTRPQEVVLEPNATSTAQNTDNTTQSSNNMPFVEGDNMHKTQPAQNQNGKDLRWLWSGILGGGIVVLALLVYAIIKPGFRMSAYYINEDPSLLTELLSANISATDSIMIENTVKEESKRRKEVIEDLLDQKVIISSEEFASNLTGYYNTLVEVLAGILIILNVIGYFSLKSNADFALKKKQNELDDVINNIDERLEGNMEEAFSRNSVIKEKIENIFGNLYDESAHLSDEEWEKLHLLLAMYKKEERLEVINAQDDQNDGEIE